MRQQYRPCIVVGQLSREFVTASGCRNRDSRPVTGCGRAHGRHDVAGCADAFSRNNQRFVVECMPGSQSPAALASELQTARIRRSVASASASYQPSRIRCGRCRLIQRRHDQAQQLADLLQGNQQCSRRIRQVELRAPDSNAHRLRVTRPATSCTNPSRKAASEAQGPIHRQRTCRL